MLWVGGIALVLSFNWQKVETSFPQLKTLLGSGTQTTTAGDEDARFAVVASRGAVRVLDSKTIQTTEDLVRCVELAYMVEFDGKPPAKLNQLQDELQQVLGVGPEDTPVPLDQSMRTQAAKVLRSYAGETD